MVNPQIILIHPVLRPIYLLSLNTFNKCHSTEWKSSATFSTYALRKVLVLSFIFNTNNRISTRKLKLSTFSNINTTQSHYTAVYDNRTKLSRYATWNESLKRHIFLLNLCHFSQVTLNTCRETNHELTLTSSRWVASDKNWNTTWLCPRWQNLPAQHFKAHKLTQIMFVGVIQGKTTDCLLKLGFLFGLCWTLELQLFLAKK